ncbi:MAG: hypothetical protein U9N85_12375, partial [Bacteroidota bacterium]|nr:hypothetical protein [Bacteroidota bacterium]
MKQLQVWSVSLIFGIVLSMSCSEEIAEKSFVRPPFPALNPEYVSFDFEAEEGGEYIHESGTKITVPGDLWEDKEGNPVSGTVRVKYREFHDAVDIFLSGSSMNYDSAGVQEVFQTAGMFEIRAYKDSSEIFIKKGKSLEVKMASYKDEADYNFYTLDENERNWKYQGRTEPEINSEIALIKDSVSKLKSEKVFSIKDNAFFALNYSGLLDVYFQSNPKNFKYGSKLPKRRAEKYGLIYSGIHGYNNVTFRGRTYAAWEMVWETQEGRKLPWWSKNSGINKLTYLGNNLYYMNFQSHKNSKHRTTIKIKAIMPIRYLFATSPEDWQAKYDDIMKRIDVEQSRLEKQAAVYRTFKVNTTGLCNWDRIMKQSQPLFAKSNFTFDKITDEEFADIDVYYFVRNNETFSRFNLATTDSIQIAQDSTAQFVAVLSDNEAAVFNAEAYSKI